MAKKTPKKPAKSVAKDAKKSKTVSQTGSQPPNLHEGSRSEYLAQFVFSWFGTSIPVPRQEDTGIDLYCTLTEQVGKLAWPRDYYSVQVKSNLNSWKLTSPESVRWIIEHPLPIFLCVVEKAEARILVYHTSPRFAAWVMPGLADELELILGRETKAATINWNMGTTSYSIDAPILNFTIEQFLDASFRDQVKEVLKFWIWYDLENLSRIRSGIHRFWVPGGYETNKAKLKDLVMQGGNFRQDTLPLAQRRLKELLGVITSHYYQTKDMQTASICAMALRQLCPGGDHDPYDQHDGFFHFELNRLFGPNFSRYMYDACDSLLQIVKDELARHGIAPRQADRAPKRGHGTLRIH